MQINGTELSALTHPSREQWMSYLYGELPRAAKADLAQHLRTCPVCQMDVTVWQNAKGSLGAWKIIRPERPAPVPVVFSAFKWAMPALVMLGVGFTVGRFAQANSDRESLRAALAPELKAALLPDLTREVQEQLQADYGAVLAGGPEASRTEFRRQLRALLDDTKLKAVTASTAQTEHALLGFAETYRTDRDEAQQAILNLFDRAERKRQAEYVSLRRAVETVAVVADDKFQRTESQLGQLESYAQAKLISDSPDRAQ